MTLLSSKEIPALDFLASFIKLEGKVRRKHDIHSPACLTVVIGDHKTKIWKEQLLLIKTAECDLRSFSTSLP